MIRIKVTDVYALEVARCLCLYRLNLLSPTINYSVVSIDSIIEVGFLCRVQKEPVLISCVY